MERMREDWVNCTLGDLLTLKNGFAFKSTNYISDGIPVIRIGDINDWLVDETQAKCVSEEEVYDEYTLIKGDILMAMSGATTGKFGIYKSDKKAYQNQRVGNLRPHSKVFLNKKYVFNLLYSLKFQIEKGAYGGAQPNISAGKIHALNTILAPLPEQRAIVTKIEAIFSDLDQGIADLKKAQGQLKVYRQAVLKKAFEGNVESALLGEITDIRGGVTKGRKLGGKETVDLPYLRVANVQDGYLDLKVIKTICVLPTDLEKYRLEYEDILFTEGGDRDKLGRGTVWKNEIDECIHQNHIFRSRVKDSSRVSPYYLTYYAQSPDGKDFFYKHGKHTTNLASINKTVLSNLPIPLPSLKEQLQIVREIESRLSVCDKVEKTITESLAKAQALRQSILKKAFEGKLLSATELAACKLEVDWEPAGDLLERIKKEKVK